MVGELLMLKKVYRGWSKQNLNFTSFFLPRLEESVASLACVHRLHGVPSALWSRYY